MSSQPSQKSRGQVGLRVSATAKHGSQSRGTLAHGAGGNQPTGRLKQEQKVVGFIDLGTNSVRLLVARFDREFSYTILRRDKEMIRLGEGEFPDATLKPEAMARAATVCASFVETARSLGADEIHGVATAATREARNRKQFVAMLRERAGLDIRVVSGIEEARLMYLGAASGLNLGRRSGLFIDIGGGSTELAIGSRSRHAFLDTIRVGAIHLSSKFTPAGHEGPISDRQYTLMCGHVRNKGIRAIQGARGHPFRLTVGTSGTIENLAEVAALRFLGRSLTGDDRIPREQIRRVVHELRGMPLKDRRKVAGLNPSRADIIVGGAAILETLMDELGVGELRVVDRGVRDGLLLDYVARREAHEPFGRLSIRQRSVLRLARLCDFNETHARVVTRLALGLFDSARRAGLHDLDEEDRELLEYAATLHDIGMFLSQTNHQFHTCYFIKGADLLGFDQTEIDIMATTALFHRKHSPSAAHPEFAALSDSDRAKVEVMALLLRLAESLDRSHSGLVRQAGFTEVDDKAAVLEIVHRKGCDLELWGAEGQAKAFKRAFGRQLAVRSRPVKPEAAANRYIRVESAV